MKKQQTAVEWLIDKHFGGIENVTPDFRNKIEQAIAMEKKQIIEAWHNGYENQSPMIDEENCGKNYYNETFKNKQTCK